MPPGRQVMGKGIPDMATEQEAGGGETGKHYSNGSSPKLKGAEGKGDETSAALLLQNDHAKNAAVGPVDSQNSEDRIDKRIHALDCARRQMAVAGSTAAAACLEDPAATQSGAARSASHGRYGTCPYTQ